MNKIIQNGFAVIAIVGVVLSVVSVTEAGRTIKKHGAVLRKPVAKSSNDTIEAHEPKTDLILKESNSTVTENQESCSDEGNCVDKNKNTKTTGQTPGWLAAASGQAVHPYHQQQMYEVYWRNRFRNGSTPYKTTHRILPHLQRAALDMARGILSGFGWNIQGWELALLESIVRSVSKDMLFMLHLFF